MGVAVGHQPGDTNILICSIYSALGCSPSSTASQFVNEETFTWKWLVWGVLSFAGLLTAGVHNVGYAGRDCTAVLSRQNCSNSLYPNLATTTMTTSPPDTLLFMCFTTPLTRWLMRLRLEVSYYNIGELFFRKDLGCCGRISRTTWVRESTVGALREMSWCDSWS